MTSGLAFSNATAARVFMAAFLMVIVGGVPALGNKPGRACDRARLARPIRQVRCEHFAFVGRDKHVIKSETS